MSAAKAALTAVPATTYHYIGLEAGSLCYGGTTAPVAPTSLTGVNACTSTCVGAALGAPVQTCGGPLQFNMYASVSGTALTGPVVTQSV